jgi:predicted GIY-YIG superfamily endonuclease
MNLRAIKKMKAYPVMDYKGAVYHIHQYNEFNAYIKAYINTDFAKHYTLFKKQIGVYRFNCNGETQYVGYSINLWERVRESFFNHCLSYECVEFQYILCDNKEEAIKLESYYIQLLKPRDNSTGKKPGIYNDIMPGFCNAMLINFNEYYHNTM